MKRIILTASACALLALCTLAQGKLAPNTQIRLMLDKDAKSRSLDVEMLSAYIHIDDDSCIDRLKELGIEVNLNLGNIITARIPANVLNKLEDIEGVAYIQLAQPAQPMLDKAREVAGVNKVQVGSGLPQAYSGKGVVVGIIDAGFDYTHPAFYTPDGSQYRVKRVWEQGTSTGTPPDGFSYGTEFTTQSAIVGARADVEYNSHGTHVANIAAGTTAFDDCPYHGVAGDADIVLVSKSASTVENVNISDAIAYIYAYADLVNKPCVINMSLGTMVGPHDGTSEFDRIADSLQGEGRLLVGSIGNFGGKPLHIETNGETINTMVNLLYSPDSETTGGDIDIWGEPGSTFSIKIGSVRKSTGNESFSNEIEVSSEQSLTFPMSGNLIGDVFVATEINPTNNRPHALITSGLTSVRSGYALALSIIPDNGATIHAWADGTKVELINNDCDGWISGDNAYSLAEIGGTGKKIISVGSFTTRNTYTEEGKTEKSLDETIGEISSFSSLGPSIDGRMKPDVVAPGCFIISAVNSWDSYLATNGIPVAASYQSPSTKIYKYGYMQGTSMSAPFVTGTIATWLQANPQLTPEKVRTVLSTTSTYDVDNMDSDLINSTWGYGKIDAYEGIKSALKLAEESSIDVIDNQVDYTIHTDDDAWIITLYDTGNTIISLYDITGKLINTISQENVQAGANISIAHPTQSGIFVMSITTGTARHTLKLVK